MRNLTAFAAIAALSIAAQLPARADAIDTFSFTQAEWYQVAGYSNSGGLEVAILSPQPDAGGTLSGTFTAKAGSTGLIDLADLTAFSATYSDSLCGGSCSSDGLADLSLFSYEPSGGASTLDFDFNFAQPFGFCVGAAVVLDPLCTDTFIASYPPGALGAAFNFYYVSDLAAALSFAAPTITLVSSVTTPPPSVPEPSTPALLATGLVILLGLAGAGAHRRKRAARQLFT